MRFIISVKGNSLSEEESVLLKNPKISGVILYGRNIGSYETTKNLISEIKKAREDLIVSIDEEGGLVSRIQHFFPNLSQPYCSQISHNEVKDYYRKRSQLLKSLGIDLNFAPVVDLALDEDSVMYKRSFGREVDKVIDLAKICIEEQHKAGIKSCIKHWPGHGLSRQDSHYELPVIDIDKREWENLEGKIFKELINNGVDYIMTGHLFFPKIEENVTTLSRYWITKVLKKELLFKGEVISDDLDMKGLPEGISIESLELAGIDQAIVTSREHPLFPH